MSDRIERPWNWPASSRERRPETLGLKQVTAGSGTGSPRMPATGPSLMWRRRRGCLDGGAADAPLSNVRTGRVGRSRSWAGTGGSPADVTGFDPRDTAGPAVHARTGRSVLNT